MNEIDKLYELAGIEQEYFEHFHGDGYDYPPFTAEKQLELIKRFVRKGLIQIAYSSYNCYQFNSFTGGGDYKPKIENALASFVILKWQDLTKTEQEEIRKILKG